MVAIGILSIAVAVGLWRGARAAWMVSAALAALVVLSAAFNLIRNVANVPFGRIVPEEVGGAIASNVLGSATGLVVAVVVLYSLFTDGVRRYFAQSTP
jgi:hypothetical protein